MYHQTAHFKNDLNERLDRDERNNQNSIYWLDKAAVQLGKLEALVGKKQAMAMVECIEGTWKFVYDTIKELVVRWTPAEPETQPHIPFASNIRVLRTFDGEQTPDSVYGQADLSKGSTAEWFENIPEVPF